MEGVISLFKKYFPLLSETDPRYSKMRAQQNVENMSELTLLDKTARLYSKTFFSKKGAPQMPRWINQKSFIVLMRNLFDKTVKQ